MITEILAGMVKRKNNDIIPTDAPLVTTTPSFNGTGRTIIGQLAYLLNPLKTELTWPTPVSLQLESGDPTSEYDVLNKLNLLGCATRDPKDQQEVRMILREYADVLAKDDLNLNQTSVIKHKITLKEEAKQIKECYRRV